MKSKIFVPYQFTFAKYDIFIHNWLFTHSICVMGSAILSHNVNPSTKEVILKNMG